jgi:hypothetical protein
MRVKAIPVQLCFLHCSFIKITLNGMEYADNVDKFAVETTAWNKFEGAISLCDCNMSKILATWIISLLIIASINFSKSCSKKEDPKKNCHNPQSCDEELAKKLERIDHILKRTNEWIPKLQVCRA